jgi:hypothetical protein
MPKQVAIVRMEGKRKKVTPWKDGLGEVEEDMKLKGIRTLHAVSRNWKEWRKIVQEAKDHNRT